MSVRAKFKVDEIVERKHWTNGEPNTFDVKLSAVTGGSDENKRFFAATPGGSISIVCARHDAAHMFRPGEEFYVDFSKAK